MQALVVARFLSLLIADWCVSSIGAESLADCLAKTECVLQPGQHYKVTAETKLTTATKITVSPGQGRAVIDGSTKLNLAFQKCELSECGSDVYVADLNGDRPFQLFLGGEDIVSRKLLLPARWPNLPDKPQHYPADAPSWAVAYDGREAWSIVKTGIAECAGPHAQSGCKSYRFPEMNRGIIDDDGSDDWRLGEQYETEEGDPVRPMVKGLGALEKEKFSAEGATLVISFGKRKIETGIVEKHKSGQSSFQYFMPYCDDELYTSCGKKAKFMDVKYFLQNSIALIDKHLEYAVTGGKLYIQLDRQADLKKRNGMFYLKDHDLWARLVDSPDFAFDVASNDVKIDGLTFFATAPTVSKRVNSLEVRNNIFIYPFASKIVAGIHTGTPRLNVGGKNCVVEGNTFMYAEGCVLEGGGSNFQLRHNLFEWNGYLPRNGPQTIKLASAGEVFRNTLRWNGQVSGFKLTGSGVTYMLNHIEHQSYGELMHDGAAFHVQINAQNGIFTKNWIHDGSNSMGIRFDTSSTTATEEIGRGGQLSHNVIWNTGMVLKGDEHMIERNTLWNNQPDSKYISVILVKAFGEQQGMNEATELRKNLLPSAAQTRGKKWKGPGNTPLEVQVTLSDVKASRATLDWLTMSGKWGWVAENGFNGNDAMVVSKAIPKEAELREVILSGNTYDWDYLVQVTDRAKLVPLVAKNGAKLVFRTERRPSGELWKLGNTKLTQNEVVDACGKVRSCHLRDFRLLQSAAADLPKNIGAYSALEAGTHWIPGHQTSVARQPSPPHGTSAVPVESSLIFLQVTGCDIHTVILDKALPSNGEGPSCLTLSNGENVWERPDLQENIAYKWRVVCGHVDCKGSDTASSWWTFNTFNNDDTSATTVPATTSVGAASTTPPPSSSTTPDDATTTLSFSTTTAPDDTSATTSTDLAGASTTWISPTTTLIAQSMSVLFEAIKYGEVCKSTHKNLGNFTSVEACAAKAHENGAKLFFTRPQPDDNPNMIKCVMEDTSDVTCPEGWKKNKLSTSYEVKSIHNCAVLPISMNGPAFSRGCPGAAWGDGSPSKRYCRGAKGAYPWWAACCVWDAGQCKAIPDTYDCSIRPQSLNGPSFGTGCPGAVWSDGSPSRKYCNGNRRLNPWYSKCCKWEQGTCKAKWAVDNYGGDCKILPVSMNGFSHQSGCPGAVWGSGEPSKQYCDGLDKAGQLSYGWWNTCCRWDAEEKMCKPKNSSTRRLQSNTLASPQIISAMSPILI